MMRRWQADGSIDRIFSGTVHKLHQDHIPTDTAILKKWLKAGFVHQDELFPTEAGAPEGGIIAPATT
jgi:RNA-directed DNA polymerase